MTDETASIVGGALFLLEGRRIGSISWPLVELSMDHGGVSLRIRSRLVERIGALLQTMPMYDDSTDVGSPLWCSSWDDVIAVEFVRRGQVSFFSTSPYEVRFGGCGRRRIEEIYLLTPNHLIYPPPEDR